MSNSTKNSSGASSPDSPTVAVQSASFVQRFDSNRNRIEGFSFLSFRRLFRTALVYGVLLVFWFLICKIYKSF